MVRGAHEQPRLHLKRSLMAIGLFYISLTMAHQPLGASAGIGAALVRKLTSHGIKVVGCARRVDFIETMAKANPLLFAYKVSQVKCFTS